MLRLQVVYGEGVENYMNDAPVDIGIQEQPLGNPVTPVVGKALPVLGLVAFLDHTWNAKWTSTVGYSLRRTSPTATARPPTPSRRASTRSRTSCTTRPRTSSSAPRSSGATRDNFSDGFTSNDFRIQFSVKYNFKYQLGGK